MDRTTTRPGRLLDLGLVLDPRNEAARLVELGRMADRAGLDALFVGDGSLWPACPPLDVWPALELIASAASRAVVGAILDARRHRPEDVATRMGTVEVLAPGRLEIVLVDADEAWLAALRGHRTVALSLFATGTRDIDLALRAGHGVLVGEPTIEAARARATAAGREAFVVSVELPVSIGRTTAEAAARADAEPLFSADHAGRPEQVGVFGTLEQCQRRVAPLVAAGLSRLLCVIPNAPDVHDVIAQLTALPVGLHRSITDAAPSRPPEPPKDWGGRPRRQ